MFKDYYDKLIRQLAIDHNCSPADFCAKDNIITVSALNEGRRSYSAEKPFLQMATLGGKIMFSLQDQVSGQKKRKISSLYNLRNCTRSDDLINVTAGNPLM